MSTHSPMVLALIVAGSAAGTMRPRCSTGSSST